MLHRTTVVLGITQLISWGVLFYGFAVVAPEVTAETGWSESAVTGAFSVGLLTAGLSAPTVAGVLARHGPRRVLTAGSAIGASGMVLFASAHHLAVVYLAWVVVGVAMALTLYEPAMAILIGLDPSRRHRTLPALTIAAGLASTVFAPISGALVAHFGWRNALALLAIPGGVITAALHAFGLPKTSALATSVERTSEQTTGSWSVRRLRIVFLLEQSAALATTIHLTGLLIARGASVALAGTILGAMGVGKLVGRFLLLRPIHGHALIRIAIVSNVAQAGGLAAPFTANTPTPLIFAATIVGAASGVMTVLRPLIVLDLVGAGQFAGVNAHLQRTTAVARAAAPLALAVGVNAIGWRQIWMLAIAPFLVVAERYWRLGDQQRMATG